MKITFLYVFYLFNYYLSIYLFVLNNWLASRFSISSVSKDICEIWPINIILSKCTLVKSSYAERICCRQCFLFSN